MAVGQALCSILLDHSLGLAAPSPLAAAALDQQRSVVASKCGGLHSSMCSRAAPVWAHYVANFVHIYPVDAYLQCDQSHRQSCTASCCKQHTRHTVQRPHAGQCTSAPPCVSALRVQLHSIEAQFEKRLAACLSEQQALRTLPPAPLPAIPPAVALTSAANSRHVILWRRCPAWRCAVARKGSVEGLAAPRVGGQPNSGRGNDGDSRQALAAGCKAPCKELRQPACRHRHCRPAAASLATLDVGQPTSLRAASNTLQCYSGLGPAK